MLGHARGFCGTLKAVSSRKYRICGSAVANGCCLLVEGSDALCSWDLKLVMSVLQLVQKNRNVTNPCQMK